MLRRLFSFACLFFLVLSARAQGVPVTPPVSRATAPVPLVPPPPKDPTLNADGSVTFDLLMPHAERVQVLIEGFAKPFEMQRDTAAKEPGHWTYTQAGLPPEFYSYTFLVDGVSIPDPHNVEVKLSAFRVQSVFLVPGHQLWEVRDVPHGVVHQHEYESAIVKRSSRYYVYTPPGFDATAKKVYPVLYLLHGYSDEGDAWTSMAKANTILDNLIAEGKAQPMIVVMPLGYGDMDMIRRGWAAWTDQELVKRNFRQFGEALYREVMPRVKAEYPLSSRREDHAIAGLSMGGAETLLVGLNHTQDFAWIGAFSAGGIGSGPFGPIFPAITPESGPKIQSSLRLLWVSCGTEDGLSEPNRKLVEWLRSEGMQPKYVETPGMHVWMVWRDNLSHFAPLLFQPKG